MWDVWLTGVGEERRNFFVQNFPRETVRRIIKKRKIILHNILVYIAHERVSIIPKLLSETELQKIRYNTI